MFVQCREVGVSAPLTQVLQRIGHSYLRVRSKKACQRLTSGQKLDPFRCPGKVPSNLAA